MSSDIPDALARLSSRMQSVVFSRRTELAEIEKSTFNGSRPRRALLNAQAAVSNAMGRRDALQSRIMVLIAQVGAQAMKRFDSSGSTLGVAPPNGGLCAMLSSLLAPVAALAPALAHCLAPVESSKPSTYSDGMSNGSGGCGAPFRLGSTALKPFRTFWVHMLSGRVLDGAIPIGWSQEWHKAVRIIALYSPVLVARGAASCFDTDVGMAVGGGPSGARSSVSLEAFVAEQVRDILHPAIFNFSLILSWPRPLIVISALLFKPVSLTATGARLFLRCTLVQLCLYALFRCDCQYVN